MSGLRITAQRGDITTVRVDAIVNAANRSLHGGGGGVNGAIHRVGGPRLLAGCVARFPNGLGTGAAGWTTAGELPARWVIHTVGPDYRAGETDRALLESCYRRALEVADELGASSIAFPLIGTGAHGWPRRDAIAVAVETIASSATAVDDVRLVTMDQATLEQIDAELARATPLRILQAVRVLHQRGYRGVRILPGMSPSGMHWRVSVTTSENLDDASGSLILRDWDRALNYTTGGGSEFAGARVTVATSPEVAADVILAALPELSPENADPSYEQWYDELMKLVERHGDMPIAYADYFDEEDGWEIGWGSGIRHPHPPTQGG